MNRVLKPLLILIGLALVGYALYFKILAIHSPRSAWGNNLENAARRNDGELMIEFSRIMDHVESGWNAVVYAGIVVVIVACFIRSGSRGGKP